MTKRKNRFFFVEREFSDRELFKLIEKQSKICISACFLNYYAIYLEYSSIRLGSESVLLLYLMENKNINR